MPSFLLFFYQITFFRTLSTCVPYTKLILLDLSYNKLTDIGVVDVLNTLKKIRPMRVLRLFGNQLGHSTGQVKNI